MTQRDPVLARWAQARLEEVAAVRAKKLRREDVRRWRLAHALIFAVSLAPANDNASKPAA